MLSKKVTKKHIKDSILVSIIMGSKSDWATMKHTAQILETLNIKFETLIISAHRTPDRLFTFAKGAASRGIKIIIAGAGGAAHLPGMVASLTTLPVLGVPIDTKHFQGLDSLLSIVQMPAGIPVGTLAVGEAGAKNAALLSAAILSITDNELCIGLEKWRQKQTNSVTETPYEE
ncbi:N5-carboxyaminoimidazole ribonucleotide mutase [Rickettsiales bacterium Ac37b]|nr:N5-carboxyaminoimidazole ribonucleotide mutase [Rickettsiales bacterium Ac37b]